MHPSSAFVAGEFLNSSSLRSPDEVLISLRMKDIPSLTEIPCSLRVRSVVRNFSVMRRYAAILQQQSHEFLPQIPLIDVGADPA